MIISVLTFFLGLNPAVASPSAEELRDKFLDTNSRVTQLINREMDESVTDPDWSAIEKGFDDVEVAFRMLKDAGSKVEFYDTAGKLVGTGFAVAGGVLLSMGLKKVERQGVRVFRIGGILVPEKFKGMAFELKKTYGIASAVMFAGGVGYYFYTRSKSKALQEAMDREIKVSDDLFRSVCMTYKMLTELQKKEKVVAALRWPSIAKSCAAGKLDAFVL